MNLFGRVGIWAASLTLLATHAAGATAANAPMAAESASPDTAPITVEASRLESIAGKAARKLVTVRFRNTGGAVADEVRFRMQYNGSDQTIIDKGMFSPGVLIVHTFVAGPLFGFRDASAPTISYVHFVDGTHWSTPDLIRRQASKGS